MKLHAPVPFDPDALTAQAPPICPDCDEPIDEYGCACTDNQRHPE